MTDYEIRVAIAESLGKVERLSEEQFAVAMKEWESEPEHPHSSLTKPVKLRLLIEDDYPNDLDAMAEVEKSLQPLGIYPEHYAAKLMEIVPRRERTVSGERTSHMSHYFDLIHATARQRAEAYLRVKGLWKELMAGPEQG